MEHLHGPRLREAPDVIGHDTDGRCRMTPTPAWRPPVLTTSRAVASITGRQAEVLDGLCDGLSNKQIAARLFVTEDTVKSHVKAVLSALGARDRGHAAALAATGQIVIHVRGYYEPTRRRAAA